jgi:hypothetical protein
MIVNIKDAHIEKFIRHYGVEAQIEKCKEELTELLVELNAENPDGRRIIDECADVIITAFQIAYIFGVDNVIFRIKYKIGRLRKRIICEQFKRLIFDIGIRR